MTIQEWMEKEREAKRRIDAIIAEHLADAAALNAQWRWHGIIIAVLVVLAVVGAVIWTGMP